MVSLENKIAALIIPSLQDLGYELVRVQLGGGKNRPTLQIMAEPAEPAPGSDPGAAKRMMNVDDCSLISQQISALLDVNDAIPGAYVLEVSSPGIDRPLTRVKDFQNWSGHEALIETHDRIDGRGRFRGVFEFAGDHIMLAQDGKTYQIPFTEIRKAKLVLTDELIRTTQKGAA